MKLHVQGVSFAYGAHEVLHKVAFTVPVGTTTSLVGPNGSGKTTLLRCINRILKPKAGTVLIDGIDIRTITPRDAAQMIGYVPQSTTQLFPSTVFDAVLLGRRPHMSWRVSEHDKEVVCLTLSILGLDDYAMRSFDCLSGGERQKILIARALAQEPRVLLLDEPTSNLDLYHQLDVLNVLREVVAERQITAVMAIHDLNLASRFSGRVVLLDNGHVCAEGVSDEVLTPEIIRDVYRVETAVSECAGVRNVVPLRTVDVGPHRRARSKEECQ
jgi:iron complex transport system ATP-binding protein